VAGRFCRTWSAAEEFAAVLQDNRAALIVGAPTGGADCGHTDGGTPTTFAQSREVLKLPDCVRLRATATTGSNDTKSFLEHRRLPQSYLRLR
jgi:hypothetical protein